MTHVPTEEQKKAFKSVVRAIKKAQKLGLKFYGKQWSLVAYTKEANDYCHKFKGYGMDNNASNGTIPHLEASVLADSGADDYCFYGSVEDQQKYNPENL